MGLCWPVLRVKDALQYIFSLLIILIDSKQTFVHLPTQPAESACLLNSFKASADKYK